jgi:hypothetical protein
MASGFVAWELAAEWKPAERVFLAIPDAVSGALSLGADNGWLRGVWSLVALPLAVWGGTALLARAAVSERAISTLWRSAALPVAVVVASGHMVKALAKITSWAPFARLVAADPAGYVTSAAIETGRVTAPAALLSGRSVALAGFAMIGAAVVFAVRELILSRRNVIGIESTDARGNV